MTDTDADRLMRGPARKACDDDSWIGRSHSLRHFPTGRWLLGCR